MDWKSCLAISKIITYQDDLWLNGAKQKWSNAWETTKIQSILQALRLCSKGSCGCPLHTNNYTLLWFNFLDSFSLNNRQIISFFQICVFTQSFANGKSMTQGQFLSGIQLILIKNFQSLQPLSLWRFKRLVSTIH